MGSRWPLLPALALACTTSETPPLDADDVIEPSEELDPGDALELSSREQACDRLHGELYAAHRPRGLATSGELELGPEQLASWAHDDPRILVATAGAHTLEFTAIDRSTGTLIGRRGQRPPGKPARAIVLHLDCLAASTGLFELEVDCLAGSPGVQMFALELDDNPLWRRPIESARGRQCLTELTELYARDHADGEYGAVLVSGFPALWTLVTGQTAHIVDGEGVPLAYLTR